MNFVIDFLIDLDVESKNNFAGLNPRGGLAEAALNY